MFDVSERLDTIVSKCRDEIDRSEIEIEFIDSPVFKESDAQSYLEKRAESNPRWMGAVLYCPDDIGTYSETYRSYAHKYRKECAKLGELCTYDYIGNRTTKTISCPSCKSTMNRMALVEHRKSVSPFCPVCGFDLRPKSLLDQISACEMRSEQYLATMDSERMRLCERYQQKKWLVRLVCDE